MGLIHDINTDAVKFLEELKPDIRKALLLNKRWDDIELPKSGYDDIDDAYHTLLLDKSGFATLTDAIMILSNNYFQAGVKTVVLEGETQVEATRRHAAVAYCTAVRQTAENMYQSMWQDWLRGKGDIDTIISDRLGDNTPIERKR